MKQICLLLCSFLLLACQTGPEQTSTEVRHFSRGDAISLTRTITVPRLFSHVILQYGKVIEAADLYAYNTSCIVDQRKLGPITIQPQSYEVDKITYNEEMYSDAGATIRYFTEIYLSSTNQQQDLIISCQVLDNTMTHHSFPVSEIKQTVGDYFSF